MRKGRRAALGQKSGGGRLISSVARLGAAHKSPSSSMRVLGFRLSWLSVC